MNTPKLKPPIMDRWDPAGIKVAPDRAMPLHEHTVDALCQSISEIGLMTPPDVYLTKTEEDGDVAILIAGRHRVEAVKRLGWPLVDVRVFRDTTHAAQWEADENLARVHLGKAGRDRLRAMAVKRVATQVVGQNVPKPRKIGAGQGAGGGRPAGTVAVAAERLGVSPKTIRRALKAEAAALDGPPHAAPAPEPHRYRPQTCALPMSDAPPAPADALTPRPDEPPGYAALRLAWDQASQAARDRLMRELSSDP